MAIIKCKMCGGDLNLIEGASTAECEFCGSLQTIPNLDDEKKLIQFERAERLRKQCEFDKAAGIYETIVADFRQEAEAYWGLVLCKYGIEYVDDPATGKKIPTCHRSSFDSIMEDSDFEQALENADIIARRVYRDEAKQIEKIRKGIIAVSANEEPYDIFICYKETSETGDRTLDSVLAQDVYDSLTDKGYRVFFSRISLEDKLGMEYEPYIFAALNSAKIMLAFGTDYEYFNAVWVKNEWSRFLKLMAKDKEKHLIPCYKGIDAYDMPKEFAKLQAQDMGKVGAIQDLLRGIEKIIPRQNEAAKETVVVQQASPAAPGVDSLLERAFMFLEDGAWSDANTYCEKVLDIDPKNAQAYLGKLMAELKVNQREDLKNCGKPFDDYNNCQKAMRFGSDALKKELQGYIDFIISRNLTDAYNEAVSYRRTAQTADDYRKAATKFSELGSFKDSADMAKKCLEEVEQARLLVWYDSAVSSMKAAKTEKQFKEAATSFVAIKAFRDAEKLAAECLELAEEKRIAAKEQERIDREWQEAEKKAAEEKRIANIKTLPPIRKRIRPAQSLFVTGSRHTVGLRADGTVVAVGYSGKGQCDVSNWKDIVAVSACDSCTVGLKADGTVVAVGNNDNGQCNVSDWEDIVAVSSGSNYTVGLKADGTVVAVGNNDNGQCDVSNWENIVAVSAGGRYTIGLKDDGTEVAVSDGSSYTVGLKDDGTVVAVGYNDEGQCNVSDWKDIVAVSAGWQHTVGLRADGTVVAVGYSGEGQCDISNWKDIVAVSAEWHHTVGLKADGTVVAVGENRDGQCNVSDWEDIVAISAGNRWTVGLKADGTVVAVGENYDGQCDVSEWRLFQNIDNLETEQKEERHRAEERRRIEETRKFQENCRSRGVCQHCGGELKGFFGKKCVSCGRPKDY